MTKRTVTLEQMDALFCSAEFLKKVRASSKSSAEVFAEATDAEVQRWLREGTASAKRIYKDQQ